jgi:hypothetical protein
MCQPGIISRWGLNNPFISSIFYLIYTVCVHLHELVLRLKIFKIFNLNTVYQEQIELIDHHRYINIQYMSKYGK